MRQVIVIVVFLALIWGHSIQSVAADGPNDQIEISQMTALYEGTLSDLPVEQGLIYFSLLGTSTEQGIDGTVLLDSTPERADQVGYTPAEALTLVRHSGYQIQFSLQLLAETHANPNRAGFSLIVISSDGQYGIELGFWPDEIWVQEGGPPPDLFTHAEGALVDTTAALTPYQLEVSEDSYTLSMDGTVILSGPLRDYSAFSGLVDPYEIPNFLFLGDNSTTSAVQVRLAQLSVVTVTTISRPRSCDLRRYRRGCRY